MKDEQLATLRIREEVEEIASSDVIDYLRRHPDFFLRHDDVLMELQLPHRSGSAVSLVERQVSLLRERNIESRHRLSRLLEAAHENDQLFAKTRQLTLSLLEADSLEQLASILVGSMRSDFGADKSQLLLVEDPQTSWHEGGARIARDTAQTSLQGVFRTGKPIVGPLRAHEKELLFGADADQILSAALVPVGVEQPVALLLIGSVDAKRFHAEMGTLFLEFIGSVLQRLLPRFRH